MRQCQGSHLRRRIDSNKQCTHSQKSRIGQTKSLDSGRCVMLLLLLVVRMGIIIADMTSTLAPTCRTAIILGIHPTSTRTPPITKAPTSPWQTVLGLAMFKTVMEQITSMPTSTRNMPTPQAVKLWRAAQNCRHHIAIQTLTTLLAPPARSERSGRVASSRHRTV